MVDEWGIEHRTSTKRSKGSHQALWGMPTRNSGARDRGVFAGESYWNDRKNGIDTGIGNGLNDARPTW
eukprot:129333-Pyramimonas_sp.AAC.1